MCYTSLIARHSLTLEKINRLSNSICYEVKMLFFKVSDDTSYEFRKKERNPVALVYKFSLSILSNGSSL